MREARTKLVYSPDSSEIGRRRRHHLYTRFHGNGILIRSIEIPSKLRKDFRVDICSFQDIGKPTLNNPKSVRSGTHTRIIFLPERAGRERLRKRVNLRCS